MKLPKDILTIRDRYVAAFPLWVMDPGAAAEDRARQWAIGLCEQMAFERPGQGWGTKRADPGRPISKDALARLVKAGTAIAPQNLLAWDQLSGAGSGAPSLVADPDSIDISDQVFVAVTPTNHLSGQPPAPEPTPPPKPTLPPYAGDEWGWTKGKALFADYAAGGQSANPGMGVWFERMAHSYMAFYAQGMTADAATQSAIAKHRPEWRGALGLPPVR